MAMHAADTGANKRLQVAFEEEEYAALRLLTRARVAIIAVIVVWVHIENPLSMAFYYDWYIGGFLVLTAVPFLLRRGGYVAAWPRYLFPLLDMLLMVLVALVPNLNEFPRQMVLRFGNELYLFLLLSSAVLSYSPGAVLWAGLSAALLWTLGNLWIYLLPDTIIGVPRGNWMALTASERLALFLDPHHVNAGTLGRQVLLLLVISAVLALAVRRSRALLLRQTAIERERANLSRYFSPNMVEELAQSDEPLGATRTQAAAVLFADIAGFTRWSAAQAPAAVIALLREFHGRMARAVFYNGGTLDKFLGDGVMATFGTPRVGSHDALSALHCARMMLSTAVEWNRERGMTGAAPIDIRIGLHYGPVILGDIGDERHLEFAVVGDTVNVASRLQQLTRSLDTPMLVSAVLVDAARREAGFQLTDLDGLVEAGEQEIRGRGEGLRVWMWVSPAGA